MHMQDNVMIAVVVAGWLEERQRQSAVVVVVVSSYSSLQTSFELICISWTCNNPHYQPSNKLRTTMHQKSEA